MTRSYPILCSLCLFVFVMAHTSHADVVDDFEGYANSTALQSVWGPALGSPAITVEGSIVDSGSQSMKVVSSVPVIALVTNRFPSAQDWSSASSVRIRFRGSVASDPSANVEMQLLTSSGTLIDGAQVVGGAITSQWTDLTIPLAGQAGLNDVRLVQLAVFPFFTSVTVYFDSLEVDFPLVDGNVTVSETAGSTVVTEGITNETVTVHLSAMPASDVTVTPSFIPTDINITPSPGTITPGSWAAGATFSVTAVDDTKIESVENVTALFTTSSGDAAFNGLSTSNFNITINDNDVLVEPVIQAPYQEGTNIRFRVDTEGNQRYNVETAPDPTSSNWTKRIVNVPGSGATYNFPIPMSKENEAVRVTTDPLP